MMEKSAHAGEGGVGDARPTPFTISTTTYQVVAEAPAEREDTLPYFCSTPYVLCGVCIQSNSEST